ncbi:NAD(P)-binding protein [Hydrogenophaga sp.]|uniref:NAD(P)-binding protein n=1 Tax=Hydrogenophaga sp. TaxID=1904254 RepID=UPI00271B1E21|nr:NAD(P)-binding protein [Hydrogenophaga sp.]MDO9438849.1 NAD(P)-binding protein [Hydrogenophaga sp.]
MKRRLFIAGAAIGGAAAGVVGMRAMVPGLANPVQGEQVSVRYALAALGGDGISAQVRHPGMHLGHLLREKGAAPLVWPSAPARRVDVAIIGSGVAGLSCAWQLNRGGRKDFVVLQGPAPLGNASFGQHAISAYPHGAHYLPLPSRRNMHVREMLHDFGVLQEGLHDERPLYDERAIVHAGMDRVLHEGRWHPGLLPELRDDAKPQWAAVHLEFERWGRVLDEQQRAVFGTPLYVADLQGMAANDTLALDQMSFGQWLDQVGVQDATLRWYFDYCCRDEYGAPAQAISAWAGVHYFAVEHGKASNAQDSAVLTWPQGLGFLAGKLQEGLSHQQQMSMAALRVRKLPSGEHEVLCLDETGASSTIRCNKVVVATPLFMSRRLVPEMFEDLREAPGPVMSPWMVANFFMERFPRERAGEGLCWDNVVSGSRSLGYVVATHQAIGQAMPAGTVLTAYCPLVEEKSGFATAGAGASAMGAAMSESRRWASGAPAQELLAVATRDLDSAYGADWRRWCQGAELTVHGHAMAVPTMGFLQEPLARRARESSAAHGGIVFAHSDLSGYSVFEEASYWGIRAARRLLG